MPRLQRTAAKLLHNPADAEDALQDGLLAAFRHMDQFQGRAQFTTWMHTIVVNAARSKLRRQRSRPLFFSIDDVSPGHDNLPLAETLPDAKSGLDEAYAYVERARFLESMLAVLPADTRQIVELCDIEGLKIKEAAARLGISTSAAKTRHFRANRILQQMANEAGLQKARHDRVRETSDRSGAHARRSAVRSRIATR
jgi:RNA polymerase sigma-70 factor, ECF subfamily